MTPVRAPDVVRGDVPGLLDDWIGPVVVKARGSDDWEPESVVRFREGLHRMTWLSRVCRLEIDHVRLDMTRSECIYRCLHWLVDRGFSCLWMLPTTHGGRVEAWDGLTAWNVSAILVARSVGRVARGLGPVRVLGGPWRHPAWSTEAHIRVAMNAFAEGHGLAVVHATDPYGEGERGWLLQPIARMVWSRDDVPHGPETGDAGKLAADRAALADGCALQVPGGLILPDLGAEHV